MYDELELSAWMKYDGATNIARHVSYILHAQIFPGIVATQRKHTKKHIHTHNIRLTCFVGSDFTSKRFKHLILICIY